MCRRLVEKTNLSETLLVFNRTSSKAEDLSSKICHSTVAGSINDVVSRSDIIFYCLSDDDAVSEVVDKMLETHVESKLFVDCSTIHPDTTKFENDRLTRAGARFVAMPVFGAPAMAESGNLICVVAGAKEDIERLRPYTKGVMGRAVIEYADQDPSKASLLKIIGNTFMLSMITTLAEGHVLAQTSGLGVNELHQLIETLFTGPYTAYSNRMLTGDYYLREEPLVHVDLARKDARHANKIAGESGIRMRIVEVGDEYLAGVEAGMPERGDVAGIYGIKRQEAGLPFGNQET